MTPYYGKRPSVQWYHFENYEMNPSMVFVSHTPNFAYILIEKR